SSSANPLYTCNILFESSSITVNVCSEESLLLQQFAGKFSKSLNVTSKVSITSQSGSTGSSDMFTTTSISPYLVSSSTEVARTVAVPLAIAVTNPFSSTETNSVPSSTDQVTA